VGRLAEAEFSFQQKIAAQRFRNRRIARNTEPLLGGSMKSYKVLLAWLAAFVVLGFGSRIVYSQDKTGASGTVQVHMVITDEAVREGTDVPILRPENVQVKQGKTLLKVEHLIPARDDNAALQLFILIDDTCDTSIGNSLNDIRDFINAQPATTVVGIGYMSNATIQIVQNFTADHALAAKAVRLPRGGLSAMDSPYLSLISLIKGWPVQKVRREVVMVTDGIDRLRGERESGFQNSPTYARGYRNPGAGPVGMPTISTDATTASEASQRAGVIVHGIYAVGVGRAGRNSWEAQMGQSGVGMIADQSGGEYFALGTQNQISFKPYLDRLQKIFENQYYLVFRATPKKKSELQRVKISTEIADVEIAAADSVWVPSPTDEKKE
jgi:hypothetical protein